MAEKSGIDMLEELLEEVKLLHKKIDLLDRNLKTVANSAKVAELLTRAEGTKLDTFARANKPVIKAEAVSNNTNIKENAPKFKFEPTDASKIKQPAALANKSNRAVDTSKKVVVSGKLITVSNDQVIPLSQIDVQIYDDKDKLIKSTKTNRAGHWVSHMPPGKYVIAFNGEHNGKKLTTIYKKVEIPADKDEFEVK